MTANGHHGSIQILVTLQSTVLLDDLRGHFMGSTFNLVMTQTTNHDDVLTSIKDVQAILVDDSSSGIMLLTKLHEQYNTLPVLGLIVTDGAEARLDAHIMSFVDVIMPPHPHYVEAQLHTILRLKAENEQLAKKVDACEKQFTTHKRLANEMEILKNAIVRNVSHELRTPLLQVKSAVSLMAEDVDDKKLVSYAENATGRLETLVKNITMLGTSLDIKRGPIILRDAIDYARRNLARTWRLRVEADRIRTQLEDNLPPVLADKQGLSTALQLLMDNALKFSDGDITVKGERRGNVVYVAVIDTGIGIAEDKIQDIFESFYQIDSSSTRRYGGAGVGLALVKLILDNHNVTIHVESAVGKGSTFWFELPIVDISDATSFD